MQKPRQIVLNHWNASALKRASARALLPELVIYSLLYDELLIREEDLITNRTICKELSDDANFTVFSELLICGFIKILRIPTTSYPPGR